MRGTLPCSYIHTPQQLPAEERRSRSHPMKALLYACAQLTYVTWCANASIILGKGHGKYSLAKDHRVTEVGVGAVHPICDALVSECISSDEQVQDELIVALEAGGHTTGERTFLSGFL